jgi:hypothetical protein
MIKKITFAPLILVFLFHLFITPANALDSPKITTLSQIETSKLYFNDDTGYRDVEITPWALGNHKLGGNYLYIISSYNTHLCDDIDSLFSPSNYKKISNCKLRQSSAITPSTVDTNNSLWKRDFYGSFSGHLLSTKNDMVLYTINHGELLNNNYFPTQPCHPAPDIGYGTFPCTNAYNDQSYNAFIGMSSFSWNLANFNSTNTFVDSGPIVWPANGYVENGHKATGLGILHPSSIIKDNYLYVFFRDTSSGSDTGRTSGLKTARAPITSSGVDPLSFKTYYLNNFTENALPTGFNKENILNFFSQKGGRSSALFTNDNSDGKTPDIYSFAVAKLTGTNLYLGAAQDLNLGVTLRLSYDLVNWSQQTIVPDTEFNYFTDGGTPTFIKQPFMYPRLISADGDNSSEIDPNNFYIIGNTKSSNPFNSAAQANIINQLHLKLTDLPSPNLAGDYNNDNHINAADYTIFIAGFGTKYTILDYATLVANWGK